MASALTQRIQRNPQYQHLIHTRDALSWRLTFLVLIAYFGFLLVVAFDNTLFTLPIAAGMATSWGILAAIGIILLTIVTTAIYVRKANRDYDSMVQEILEKEVQP